MASSRPADPFEPMSIDLLKSIAKFMKLLNLRRILNNTPNQAFTELPDDTRLEHTFTLARKSHQEDLGVQLPYVFSAKQSQVRVIFTGIGKNNLYKRCKEILGIEFNDASYWASEPGIVIFAPDFRSSKLFVEDLDRFYNVYWSKGFPSSSFLEFVGVERYCPVFVTHRTGGEWRNFPRVTISLGPPKSVPDLVQILRIGAPLHVILCGQEKTACQQLEPILEYLDSHHTHPSDVCDPRNPKKICPAGKP